MAKILTSVVSENYAKALFDLAKGEEKKILQQLDEVIDVIDSSDDLRIVMANSAISVYKKLDIINSIFSEKVDNKVLNLLKVLTEKNRFGALAAVRESYSNLEQKFENLKKVVITSPIELNFENKTNVLFALEHKLNCEIKPVWQVDKSLIAGLTFAFDDCIIDTSVRAKLNNLRKNINR